MKKYVVISLFSLSLLLTIQCKSDQKDKTSKVELQSTDKKDVDEIIKFNNDFIKLSSGRETFIKGINRYLEAAESTIQGDDFSIAIKPLYLSSSIGKSDHVPNAIGDAKKELETHLKTLNEKFESIKTMIDSIEKYIGAEDFKDDQGAKFQELKSKIEQDLLAYNTAYGTFITKLTPITMAAEEEVLKDHPLKKQILNSRKNLDLVENLIDEISLEFETKKFNHTKIETLYKELEKSYQENAAMKIDEKDKTYGNRKRSFENYNKSLESFLGAVRKLMRDSKEKNTINEEDFNDLESPYSSVVSAYNNFVD